MTLVLILAFIQLILAPLSGCKVGPNYKPPATTMPAAWGEAGPTISSQPTSRLAGGAATGQTSQPAWRGTMQPAELADWWKQFHDPVLDQLIGQSIAGNLMLRQAQAHIRQARFERQIVAANLYPAAAATASYEHLRFSKNGLGASAVAATNPSGATGGGAAGGATGGSGRGSSPNFNLFQAGFDASWELDVFGGIRRAVEAADANIGSSIEDQRDVLVSLLGEVALNYVQLRGFQRQIAIAQENLETQRQTLALTQLRLDGGIATELDVDQAAAQVAATESTIQPLETSARQAIHLLGVLTGREPMALVELLAPTSPIPAAPPEIPLGLPSDLLNQRADVRRAERQLASATAQIGVAVAQLYPSFSLMGNFGWQSTHLHNLFSSNSIAWSASPQVSVPIFQGGALRANIRLHTAIQEQAASAYEQAVLTALKDVEDALVAYANEQEHLQKLADAVAANEKTLALAKLLFDQGRTDFLNVLDAQRSLFIAQDAQVRSQSALSTDVVTLYKALGGGWEAVRQE